MVRKFLPANHKFADYGELYFIITIIIIVMNHSTSIFIEVLLFFDLNKSKEVANP